MTLVAPSTEAPDEVNDVVASMLGITVRGERDDAPREESDGDRSISSAEGTSDEAGGLEIAELTVANGSSRRLVGALVLVRRRMRYRAPAAALLNRLAAELHDAGDAGSHDRDRVPAHEETSDERS